MEAKTHLFFPVPVTVINFGDQSNDLNDRLVADSFKEQLSNPTASRSVINGWQSEGGLENKYESFSELRDNIKKVIESILPNLGFTVDNFDDYFQCIDLWVNILSKQGSFNIPHIHGTGETLFSGVYYPSDFIYEKSKGPDIRASSVPEPGDLMLFDPAGTEKRSVIPQAIVNRYPYYGSEICIRPTKGTLIVFPSYLLHMVTPLYGEYNGQQRMSISFSYSKK